MQPALVIRQIMIIGRVVTLGLAGLVFGPDYKVKPEFKKMNSGLTFLEPTRLEVIINF